jgi:hypothetical protein
LQLLCQFGREAEPWVELGMAQDHDNPVSLLPTSVKSRCDQLAADPFSLLTGQHGHRRE